jgi:peroxiredoxin
MSKPLKRVSAPNFILLDKEGFSHDLSKMYASYIIIHFSKKNSKKHHINFSKNIKRFHEKGAHVIGITQNKSDLKIDKLNHYILEDSKNNTFKDYKVKDNKTIVLDDQKKIISIFEELKDNHIEEVLNYLDKIES